MIEVENIRNVENIDVKFENIENANIRDEVFEVFDEMKVDFENIMTKNHLTKKCYPTIVDVLVI